jgi:hypothetical protein
LRVRSVNLAICQVFHRSSRQTLLCRYIDQKVLQNREKRIIYSKNWC